MAETFLASTDMTPVSPATHLLALQFIAPLGDHKQGQYFLPYKLCVEQIFIMLTLVSSPKINLLLLYSFDYSH